MSCSSTQHGSRVGFEPPTPEYGVRGVNHKAIVPPIDFCAWLSNVTEPS